MDTELCFKTALIVLLISLKLIRLPVRHQISVKVSLPAFRKNPQDWAVVTIMGLFWLFAVIVYFFFPYSIVSANLLLPSYIRWFGVVLGGVGVAVLGWGDHSLGSNLSVTLEIKEKHTLITRGAYRWVRHPIYTGALVFSFGVLLVSSNWMVGGLFLVGIALLIVYRIPREEKMLIDEFGDAYRRYAAETGALFPRL